MDELLDLPAVAAAFGRRLHAAGVPVTPERSARFAAALALTRPTTREPLYWTAFAVFVSAREQAERFDRVFGSVFDGYVDPGEQRGDPGSQAIRAGIAAPQRGARLVTPAPAAISAGASGLGASVARGDEDALPARDTPLALASDAERLAEKSFATLEPDELAQLRRMMGRLALATPRRRSRRAAAAHRGERLDLRRTIRKSLRTGGDPVEHARRLRRQRPRRLVLLCDISGSMEPYARAYIQFLECAAGGAALAEAFVFATRLTRITRALRAGNPEAAIRRAAATAPDWSSGTRIGEALKAFNDRHGRRGMAHGAVVVILSDGWERGDPELVAREMARLARLAHRIVWVNPRVASRDFAPLAGGMAAALPYCDALLSGHTLTALDDVVEAIAA